MVQDPELSKLAHEAGKLTLVNFVKRPGYGTTGRSIDIYANSYEVINFPTSTVIQYDVQIGNAATSRGAIRKVWQSRQLKEKIGLNNWNSVLFDGNKLAW
ncbi:hypothetical protein BDZ91DRAFT_660279, partial [Kalaharituber pfeilii]